VQPADIAIELRRRSPWEAMDLGLSMLQRWWRLVYAPHLVVATAVAAAALGVAWLLERPWVALLLIWWLKPLADRVVLHVLSRAVFGERQGARAVFAHAGEWLRTGLLSYLLLRWWPDLARSFYLPVRQLEGQGGARRGLLGRRVHGYAVWLTIVCLHFEAVLYWSLGFAAELLLPATATEGKDFFEAFTAGEIWSYGDAIAYAVAVAALEPFYVAAGFGLYLNRRSVLEGWDIEVALRRIAERHAAAAAAILLCFACMAVPGESFAQKKDPKHEIAEVLKAPEFPHEVEGSEWRLRNPRSPRASRDAKDPDLPKLEWLADLAQALATATRFALWIAAGALLAYALWWAARLIPQLRAPAPEPYRAPEQLFGMALAPETLPADVASAAAALAAEGKLREALGLLYRGALSELVHKRGVMLLSSHTEREVLLLSPKERQGYLSQLIGMWQLCAYALRMPTRAQVEQLAQGYRGFSS
jgi:hypothetical protein